MVVTAQVADTVEVVVMAEVVAAAATTEVTVKMQVSYHHTVIFCECGIFSYLFFRSFFVFHCKRSEGFVLYSVSNANLFLFSTVGILLGI